MFKHQFVPFILLFFTMSSFCSSQPLTSNDELNEWGYTELYDNNGEDNEKIALFDTEILPFKFRIDQNTFYFAEQSFAITRHSEDLETFILKNQLPNWLASSIHFIYGHEVNTVEFLQFDKQVLNSPLGHFLTKNRQALYMGHSVVMFLDNGMFIYSEEFREKEFNALAKQFPSLDIPIDLAAATAAFYDDEMMFNIDDKSPNVRHFLNTPLRSSGISYAGSKLKSHFPNITPVLIMYYLDSGLEVNLYLFTDEYKMLDHLLLASNERQTLNDPVNYYLQNSVDFTIDDHYQINIQYDYESGYKLFKRYQVMDSGKIAEQDITSPCYIDSPKEWYGDDPNSLLLTEQQLNHYLRQDNNADEEYLVDAKLALNMTNNRLCVNYVDDYGFQLKQMNTQQFFNDDTLYQQQVNNFNAIGIDIREQIQYIELDNSQIAPLSPWLFNGNKAIYLNNTLFFVGDAFFYYIRTTA